MRKLLLSLCLFSSMGASWAAAPQAITDLQITEFYSDSLLLTWTAPTVDVYGDTLTVNYYDVYWQVAPYAAGEDWTLHGTTADTFLVFDDVDALMLASLFFQVTAVDTTHQFPEEMVLIPAGNFTMGQSGVATPEHEVTLTHDFYMGMYEVTNQEYLEAVQWAYDQGYVTASSSTVQAYGYELLDLHDGDCQIGFSGGTFALELVHGGNYSGQSSAEHPVMIVSWYGSACYCDWRSEMDGLTPYYNGTWNQDAGHDPYTAEGYRLPTEAEWEYAARYDDGRTYPWGDESPDCDYANYGSCVGWTSPVGSYAQGASALGLFDLAGNVYEWNGDWYGGYSSGSQSDPYGATSGSSRVKRGGFWNYSSDGLRSASRNLANPTHTYNHLGFRIVRTVD